MLASPPHLFREFLSVEYVMASTGRNWELPANPTRTVRSRLGALQTLASMRRISLWKYSWPVKASMTTDRLLATL
jgi:hypothetical protein